MTDWEQVTADLDGALASIEAARVAMTDRDMRAKLTDSATLAGGVRDQSVALSSEPSYRFRQALTSIDTAADLAAAKQIARDALA